MKPERSKLDPDTAEAGTELYGHPIGRAVRAWNAHHGEWQLCWVPATILSKKALTMVVIEASKLWLLRDAGYQRQGDVFVGRVDERAIRMFVAEHVALHTLDELETAIQRSPEEEWALFHDEPYEPPLPPRGCR